MEKLLNHLFDFSLIWKFALSKLVHILFHHLYLFLREAVSKELTKRRRFCRHSQKEALSRWLDDSVGDQGAPGLSGCKPVRDES